MVMVVVVLVLMLMLVVMAAGAGLVLPVVVVVSDLLHQLAGQVVAPLHGRDDLGAGELVPGSGEDSRLGVVGTQHGYVGGQLGLVHVLGPAEEDSGGVLHLVVEELAKVLHIDLALHRVHHGDKAVQFQGGTAVPHPLHGGDDIGQLAHAGGLDDDTVGRIGVQHLLEGGAEIPYQGAADAAGIHLRDLDAGILQKAAVDADLTELVLDQDHFLAMEGLGEELLDERGLAGTQKPGDNVDFGHGDTDPFFKQGGRAAGWTEGEGGAPDTRAWYPAHSSPGNYFCRTVISLRLGPVETRVMG